MPERLTDSLVRRGKIDAGQAKEAHRRQLMLGGALDTALFELQLVSEQDVLDAIAAAYGLATLSARQATAPTEERALRVFPEQWARKHLLAPLGLSPDGATLNVLSPAPADINLLNRLGELLELAIRPVLSPELRVHQRLHQLYGAAPPDRYRTLIERMTGPLASLEPPAPSAPAPSAPPPPPPPIADKPLSFGDAVARLRDADDRDDIIRTALLYAAKDLEFVAMFINHDQVLEGRLAIGPTSERIPGTTIPLAVESAFKVVIDTHAHYLGPVPTDPVYQAFLERLDRAPPRAVLIAPVRIRNRTVAVLYGENGSNQVQPRLAADLMLFITHVQLALEALLRRRKTSSISGLPGQGGPPGAPTRQGPASVSPAESRAAGPPSVPAPRAPSPPNGLSSAPPPPKPLARIQTLSARPPPPVAPPVLSQPPMPSFEPIPADEIVIRLDPEPLPTPTLASEPPLPTWSAPPAPAEPKATAPVPDEDDDDWDPVDVPEGSDPTTPMSSKDLSAALSAHAAEQVVTPEPEEQKTGMHRLDTSVFEVGAFERAVLADHDGRALIDELDQLAALTKPPAPADETAGADARMAPLGRPKPTLAVVADDDPPMIPTNPPTLVAPKLQLTVVPDQDGPASADRAEWETGPLPHFFDGGNGTQQMHRSLAEDSTVPDLSAEAWIRASSDITKPRSPKADVLERASLPTPPEDPVPLTRLSSTARMAALSPLIPIPGDAPVVVPQKASTTEVIPRARAAIDDDRTSEDRADQHESDDTARIVLMDDTPPPAPPPAMDPIARLVLALVDSDAGRRETAANALAKESSAILEPVMAHFPGVPQMDPFGPGAPLPAFGKCSALLQLVERFGRDAHPHVVKRLDAPDPTHRFFATFFYTAVFVPEAIPRLIQRLHDEEPRICMLAARTLFSYREHADFSLVLDHLHGRLDATSSAARRHAAYLIGLFRDVTAVPKLIEVFDKKDRAMMDVAEDALAEITKQRLGSSAKKWRLWWQKNEPRSRIAWLVEGLSAKEPELRKSAAEELRAVTGLDLGYDDDAPKKHREEARLRWVKWWAETEARGTPTARA